MADLSAIVDRLATQLGHAHGDPTPLAGGITNRNYRVRFGDSDFVVRLPGKDTTLLGISRDAERMANEVAAELRIAPELAAADGSCLVTRYVPCQPLDSDALRLAPEATVLALRAFHDSGAELPVRFWVPDLLESYAEIVSQRGGSLPPEYAPTHALARQIGDVLPLTEPVPCHDDLLAANLLRVSAVDGGLGVMIVDWEYAGMGHRLFDLGNLAVNNDFDERAEDRMLTAYFGEPPTAAHRAGLGLMKIMSDAREAAWGVIQSVISELDFDFSGYAAKHFARLGAAARDPRLAEWIDAAAA